MRSSVTFDGGPSHINLQSSPSESTVFRIGTYGTLGIVYLGKAKKRLTGTTLRHATAEMPLAAEEKNMNSDRVCIGLVLSFLSGYALGGVVNTPLRASRT